MTKHQVPVLGGLRKVIKTETTSPSGTTISEIGTQSVTLAQLAALIAASTPPPNPGTPVASIALGPGLSGGGPLIGVVPIRLDTVPSVLFDVGGGNDGGGGTDGFMIPGPPGKTGTGLQGPPGWAGDDGEDSMMFPGGGSGGTGTGPPGPTGPAGPAGAAGPPGLAADDADEPLMIAGLQGQAGVAGATGAPGPTGSPGFSPDDADEPLMIPGQVGPAGATGANGIQGPIGWSGDDGDDGTMVVGLSGSTGRLGAAGPPGLEGDAGEDALFFPGPAGSSGGGAPASPTNSVQFNNAGAFGGSANLLWNGTALQLNAIANVSGAISITGPVTISGIADSIANSFVVGGNAVTGQITASITNASTTAGDACRLIVQGGAINVAIVAQPTLNTTAVIPNGPTGGQVVLRTIGGTAPLVLGTQTGGMGMMIDQTATIYYSQAAPTAVNATATLTIAQLQNGIITSTAAAATTLTLPTGTLSDAAITAGLSGISSAFNWTIINTSATQAVTLAAGTAHTIVGAAITALGTSSGWRTRKTAANTFVTYRMSV